MENQTGHETHERAETDHEWAVDFAFKYDLDDGAEDALIDKIDDLARTIDRLRASTRAIDGTSVTYADVATSAVAHDRKRAVAYVRERAGELVAAYGPSVQGAVLDIADELETAEHMENSR